MTTERNDIHRPAELVPENYADVGSYDLGGADPRYEPPVFFLTETVKADSSLWKGRYGSRLGRCDHCGAHIRYGAQLEYKPTGEFIHVGETCLSNRFSRSTAEFQRLRKNADLQRQQHRIVKLREEYLATHKRVAVLFHHYTLARKSEGAEGYKFDNYFISNVLHKLDAYGELSSRQEAAILKSFREDRARRRELVRNPPAPKIAVVEGKQTVVGKIISTKWQEGFYGSSTLKMLVEVKTDEGEYRLWGTCPAGLWGDSDSSIVIGEQVTFTATVERSENDESFGYFKRPTKAKLLATA